MELVSVCSTLRATVTPAALVWILRARICSARTSSCSPHRCPQDFSSLSGCPISNSNQVWGRECYNLIPLKSLTFISMCNLKCQAFVQLTSIYIPHCPTGLCRAVKSQQFHSDLNFYLNLSSPLLFTPNGR